MKLGDKVKINPETKKFRYGVNTIMQGWRKKQTVLKVIEVDDKAIRASDGTNHYYFAQSELNVVGLENLANK